MGVTYKTFGGRGHSCLILSKYFTINKFRNTGILGAHSAHPPGPTPTTSLLNECVKCPFSFLLDEFLWHFQDRYKTYSWCESNIIFRFGGAKSTPPHATCHWPAKSSCPASTSSSGVSGPASSQSWTLRQTSTKSTNCNCPCMVRRVHLYVFLTIKASFVLY